MKAIRNYAPGIRLRFDKLGIIGTALDSGYEKSIPMQLTDPQACIWEIKIYSKKGNIKFRTRNSWNQNWGGENLPEGKTIFYGPDIKIEEEGTYNIKVNLDQGAYRFTKVEN